MIQDSSKFIRVLRCQHCFLTMETFLFCPQYNSKKLRQKKFVGMSILLKVYPLNISEFYNIFWGVRGWGTEEITYGQKISYAKIVIRSNKILSMWAMILIGVWWLIIVLLYIIFFQINHLNIKLLERDISYTKWTTNIKEINQFLSDSHRKNPMIFLVVAFFL